MEPATSPEPLSALPEIADKLEDTPRPGGRERRGLSMGVLAFTLTSGMMTPLTGVSDPVMMPQDMTPLAEERRAENAPSLSSQDVPPASEAAAANHVRLELLARQYIERQLSTEEEARLAIVSEKVRRLIPRITVADFEALESILEEVQHIEAADRELRHRLGIE